jgi:hypothetical protein
MKAPRYVAIFVCALLAFTLLQGLAWPVRPEPGWHPSWWQFPALAGVGHILCLPGLIPPLLLENLGIFNNGILMSAAVFGLLVEMALLTVVAFFIARLWSELHSDS